MDIEDVRRIVVSPGETLVVRVPRGTPGEHVRSLGDAVRKQLPEGVKVLVATSDIEFEVITDAVARTVRGG